MKINIHNTIYRSLAIALTAGALSACDYLDVVPPETADMEDTMKDKQDALGFLYSAYSLVGQNRSGHILEPVVINHKFQQRPVSVALGCDIRCSWSSASF